jgi:hypothetical protein
MSKSEEITRPRFRFECLGPVGQGDGHSRTRGRLASILASLYESFLWWCHDRGLRLALFQIRSCYQCIRLAWRKRLHVDGIWFEELRESLPQVPFENSRNESQAYTLSIQALEKDRPWLTIADHELFAQGWYQATKWCAHSASSGRDRPDWDSSSQQFSNTPDMIGQPGFHGGSDAKASMDAAKIVIRKMQRYGCL